MATVCQPSYPLNSENASPFGTRTVYLAWPLSCAETALPPKTASTETASETTTIITAGILLLFTATLLSSSSAQTTLTVTSMWHGSMGTPGARRPREPEVVASLRAAGRRKLDVESMRLKSHVRPQRLRRT